MTDPVPAPTADTSRNFFHDLNAQQLAAVQHGVGEQAGDTRPLLVIAGAGSGKTNTLAYRVANLIRSGADPQRMMLLTFSRRAAQEMEQRVGGVLQKALGLAPTQSLPSLPWSGTFHSIGARILREYAARIGLDEAFTIHDRGDAEDLMGMVRHDIGLSETKNRFPLKGTCVGIYSRVLNTREPLHKVLQTVYPWCAQWEAELKRLFGGYVEAKQQQNVVDYDDLLLFWAEIMAEPALAQEIGERFDHLLVDEYQDTNRLQSEIILSMKPTGQGVTVVGDDAQSIYSFRGATVRNILDFPHQFAQPARIVTLERNYRSTQPILAASNAVIEQARERHAKNLWTEKPSAHRAQLVLVPDEAMQARWVADQVLQQREAGSTLKSQAVLFRTSTHSAALELELARRSIPFVKFGGLKFLEAAHVKDVMAVLRFAQNPRGRMAGFRVTQLIAGIGQATATRLLDAMAQAADPATALQAFEPPAQARGEWSQFVTLYAQLRDPAVAWPADLELAKAWYLPQLERIHDDAHVRKLDVDQLVRLAAGYGSRERFLTELTLDPPQSTSDQSGIPHLDEDYLILSTIHSAKGQEWKCVHVLNVVDGCIPSDMATGTSDEIEEERRLLYVAMTRAKDHLYLLVPHRFYVTQQGAGGDRHMYAARTRFITDGTLANFEQVTWPQAQEGSPTSARPATPVLQVRDRARAAWR
ncbi:AAA family ATPase [Caenimonas koreensis DSM 17982]|uniref:DNA 3'-5' helicase n=1 Tax=Caenimonas koreensis DSM 17982 TaxID=1121255 RepID=A0A844BCZ7_9BURK|nr:ATP-dependent helicase [Caenimonas koreensis]MRD49327.1 AAA family ATPase [Caenimonas koreensis DSM 17982]